MELGAEGKALWSHTKTLSVAQSLPGAKRKKTRLDREQVLWKAALRSEVTPHDVGGLRGHWWGKEYQSLICPVHTTSTHLLTLRHPREGGPGKLSKKRKDALTPSLDSS